MYYAEKIRMISGKENSTNLMEIDEIYVPSIGWKKKSYYYDYLTSYPDTIAVNIYPYPKLIKQLSVNNEKFVKSTPNSNGCDNLLSLPKA